MDRILYLCILLSLLLIFSYAQRDKKFFRKDYKYIEATQSFYKIHTMHKTWFGAKAKCATEGATLFYPEDQTEADAVIQFWNETQPFNWVFIGVSGLIVKGVFETVDGIPIADVYNNWAPGEPNDADGEESCVELRRNGYLNDVNCENKYAFICKKTLASLQWNVLCNIPDLGYIFNEALGKCYKFHKDPKTWTDAYAICAAEQSYLAILNSQAEADYIKELAEKASKDQVGGDYLRGAVYLGFHNRNGDGWQTIKGTKLEDSGYAKWGNQQPDGGRNETCGSMFFSGRLNDLNCNHKCFYVCEHEVDLLSASFDDRFLSNLTDSGFI